MARPRKSLRKSVSTQIRLIRSVRKSMPKPTKILTSRTLRNRRSTDRRQKLLDEDLT